MALLLFLLVQGLDSANGQAETDIGQEKNKDYCGDTDYMNYVHSASLSYELVTAEIAALIVFPVAVHQPPDMLAR